jgi:hypothetical protein
MRLKDSQEEAAFREEVRAWLNQNLTAGWRQELERREGRARIDFLRGWQSRLHAAGLAVRSWPPRPPTSSASGCGSSLP